MPLSIKVLVADQLDERRQQLGRALVAGGIEVIEARNEEEAIQETTKARPAVVLVHRETVSNAPESLQARLGAKALRLPPLLVVDDEPAELGEEQAARFIYSLPPQAVTADQVALLLLAWEVGGEPDDAFERLYGDLARLPVGDLLRILLRYRIGCHIALSVGPGAGIWVDEGRVVDARWDKVCGQKAFNRIALLRAGSFTLTLDGTAAERTITTDLPELVSAAAEARFKLDELYRKLPSLRTQVMPGGPPPELTGDEQTVLDQVGQGCELGDLIDRVPATDWEVLQAIAWLHEQGAVVFQEPEHRIHVVTDSTCDLLPPTVRRHGFTVVPLAVQFGTQRFTAGVDLQTDEFYRKLETAADFPSTSPPDPADFLDAYRQLVVTGDIVSIHLSGKQSLTLSNAEQAARDGAGELRTLREGSELPPEPVIRVVDSWSNSVGLGLLVLFASRLAQRGLKLEEIAARLEGIRQRTEFLFIVDTLKYLQKGGRIGKAQALLGGLLGIRPILGMQSGEVVPVDKVRGGRNVQPRLVEIFKERLTTGRPVFAAIGHAMAPKWAVRLKELLENEFEVVEWLEGEIGPVVGAHVGPGTVGCILFQPTDEELELLAPE